MGSRIPLIAKMDKSYTNGYNLKYIVTYLFRAANIFFFSHIKYSLYFSLSDFFYSASKILHTIWLHEDCSSTQGVAKGMTLMTSCMASQQGGGRRPCLQHCWHIKAWRDHKVQCIHYFWINQTCLNLIKHVWTWWNICLNLIEVESNLIERILNWFLSNFSN